VEPGANLDFGCDPVGTASLNAFGTPLQHNATGPPLTTRMFKAAIIERQLSVSPAESRAFFCHLSS
jgi:hypothetical protein